VWAEDGSTREGDWVSTCQSFAWAGSDGNLWLGNCERVEEGMYVGIIHLGQYIETLSDNTWLFSSLVVNSLRCTERWMKL
jgi:hypothetical protein